MLIFYLFNIEKKQCNEHIYIKALDSISNNYYDLIDKYDSIINTNNIDTIKDTITIIKKYENLSKNINYISMDSLVELSLEGTECL